MARPRKRRRLRFSPGVVYYKPRGVPLSRLEEVVIKPDELEALKLHGVDGLWQKDAAEKMKISQPTLARMLRRGYKKLAEAVIMGKAIRIEH